jgi:hypothetical protein
MRNLALLFFHFIAVLALLLGPGGVRSLVAESLLLKHPLLIVNRSRKRSPNLSAWDRILAGLMALLLSPTRLLRSAIVLKPSTLLGLHKAMSKKKYRMLFSPNRRQKPGPKGPSVELVHAVVEMKQRNPNWGCPRIAQLIALAFNIQIDKDVVRRILANHHRPGQHSSGPSRLKPRFSIKADISSGDNPRSKTLGTFNALFPSGNYFGVLAAATGPGPVNFIDVHPRVETVFPYDVSLSVDWIFQWRESLEDGLYDMAGSLIRPAGDSRARFVGHRPGAELLWHANRHLWFQADYGVFYAGL